jgi:hypothetical protein
VRFVAVVGFVVVGATATAALGAAHGRAIATSGVRLVAPTGWYARIAKTPQCDPERLIVASSARFRMTNGRIASPQPDQVIVLLLEDRLAQDRPAGDLRRPRHFTVDWANLRTLSPDGYCGNPRGPASMHYIKTHGRYLGFIVYPGARARPAVRANTLALMDSLRVTP